MHEKYVISGPLFVGSFLSRPNRFTALLKTEEGTLRCHLRDPGRLTELLVPGRDVIFRKIEGPGRKTEGEVIGIWSGRTWVLVNSSMHSDIARWLIESNYIDELKGWSIEKAEWKYGRSRIDFLLSKEGEKGLLEVKGCTLVKEGVALFPDAPTERGRRHVLELIRAIKENFEAFILFLVTRGDAEKFSPNWETDPEFSRALTLAQKSGIKVIAYCLDFDGRALVPKRELEVFLTPQPEYSDA
ncbi:MAG: DNA/RNA nuclease SfsA [Thermoproteota archaeon]|nr:MAG: DNA/RNA nuclease SfsA [Candidatus Korarchaeota archaeon]